MLNEREDAVPNNRRGLRLPSDFKTYLPEVSLHGQKLGNQGRKGLEGSQIRIGSFSKRREWKFERFKGNLVKQVSEWGRFLMSRRS